MKQIILGKANPIPGTRNTIGGVPILALDGSIPQCKYCGKKMILFLQFDIISSFGLNIQNGSHFLAFMCPIYNEINDFCSDGKRPERFWEKESGMFQLTLNPPDIEEKMETADPYLKSREILFEDLEKTISREGYFSSGLVEFKIGGFPSRINNQVEATCGCGSKMEYFCQIPENFAFEKQDSAPAQPDSFSLDEYCLFLGNMIYFLACQAQCNPLAVTAILDN